MCMWQGVVGRRGGEGLWGVVGCGQLQDKIQEFSYLNVNLNLSFWPVTWTLSYGPYFFYAYCEFPGLVGQEGNSVYLYLSSLSYSQSIVRVTCWRHDKYDFWKLSLINYWKCKKTFPPSFMGFRVLPKLRIHWINLK